MAEDAAEELLLLYPSTFPGCNRFAQVQSFSGFRAPRWPQLSPMVCCFTEDQAEELLHQSKKAVTCSAGGFAEREQLKWGRVGA